MRMLPRSSPRSAQASYADELRKIFGPDIFDDGDKAFAGVVEALEAYEQDYKAFYPYSSKYDAYLAGRATLSVQEARGLALFNDPDKGNCGNCHRSQRGKDGTPPQFTDYGMIAIGVPRNRDIPANADPKFFDLGLCGPLRTDLAGHSDYCGRFLTPTLRNVALRQSFFHNGAVHTLREAIAFYVERDTDPGKWYPRDAAGRVEKFDDLPVAYPRQHQHGAAVRPKARQRPCSVGKRDRRRDRVSQYADRRLRAEAVGGRNWEDRKAICRADAGWRAGIRRRSSRGCRCRRPRNSPANGRALKAPRRFASAQ